MNTIDGNRLIAEFMGAKWIKGNYTFDKPPTIHSSYQWDSWALQYDTSWDWLMPVVDKIETVDECSYKVVLKFAIGFVFDSSQQGNPAIIRGIGMTRIETAYNLVINFIQWYNSNKAPEGGEKEGV